MSFLLDELVAAAEKRARALPDLPPRRRLALGRFANALRGRASGQLRVVAEFKRASPSAGRLTDESPVAVARRYDAMGAAALSIVTEPTRFLGSLADLRAVAAVTPLPLLCKDFVVDRRQVAAAAAAGASAVLLIARILPAPRLAELVRAAHDHAIEPLIECRDELEVERALAQPGALVGVNNRDLDTLAIDRDRAARLLKRVPPGRIAIAESGYDLNASLAPLAGVADALLVGTALLRGASVAGLLAACPRRPLVKICGVRAADDAALAESLGARFIGCVVATDSPRRATRREIAAIRRRLRGTARLVVVDRGGDVRALTRLAKELAADCVQLHGAPPEALAALRDAGLAVLPVVALPDDASALPPLPPACDETPRLLDRGRGGGGRPFDWTLLAGHAPSSTLIAGGITPDNVAALLRHRPFGIDVSSGVESAPGRKEPALLRRLFESLERQVP